MDKSSLLERKKLIETTFTQLEKEKSDAEQLASAKSTEMVRLQGEYRLVNEFLEKENAETQKENLLGDDNGRKVTTKTTR